ncbi:MAG: carboxypeptidase regulatory-like domain-containing protein [Armatimonadetes bacterium]|nr:carboxypeptidase regulatory-like domain-containing protein [Armatimonadota bacterium]
MNRLYKFGWLTGVVIVTAALTVGCGGGGNGGGGGGGGGQPAPAGTAVLTGTVVAADNVAAGLANAVVSVLGTGKSVTADATGAFRIDGLPSGQFTVEAQTPTHADYGTTRVPADFTNGQTTTINLAVMPEGTLEPVQILLDPITAVIDLNAHINYRTQVVAENNVVIPNIEPTWVVSGGIGTITPDGVFTGRQVGNGTVTAYAGNVQRQATVQVNPPGPPQITSFQLNPRSISAGGGDVYISAAISDGDGINIADVQVEIFGPGEQPIVLGMTIPNPEAAEQCENQVGCYTRATFATTFHAPANDNQPTAAGIQAPENYSAHIVVMDRSGQTSTSSFIDFVVMGIDAPPPLPPL